MTDLEIHMPIGDHFRAAVFENVRDIGGRGYDTTLVCHLTKEETEIIRGFIDAGKLRHETTKRRVRIKELQEELERLTAAEVPEPGR